MKHFVVAVALGVTYYGVVVAETTRPAFKVGDLVALDLSDDIAAKYARLTGITTDGLSLAILARVDRLSDDGMVRIQHSCEIRNNDKTILVKLTGTFPETQFAVDRSPAGTRIFSSPVATPVHMATESKTINLRLTDMKGSKLQKWHLLEELSNSPRSDQRHSRQR